MIVLDTHALIWLIDDPDRLGAKAQKAVQAERKRNRPLVVSAISAWEVFLLVRKERLAFTLPADVWILRCERLSILRFHAVDTTIARLAVQACGDLHGDPADRMIMATAIHFGASLVTRDDKLHRANLVPCIW